MTKKKKKKKTKSLSSEQDFNVNKNDLKKRRNRFISPSPVQEIESQKDSGICNVYFILSF